MPPVTGQSNPHSDQQGKAGSAGATTPESARGNPRIKLSDALVERLREQLAAEKRWGFSGGLLVGLAGVAILAYLAYQFHDKLHMLSEDRLLPVVGIGLLGLVLTAIGIRSLKILLGTDPRLVLLDNPEGLVQYRIRTIRYGSGTRRVLLLKAGKVLTYPLPAPHDPKFEAELVDALSEMGVEAVASS